MRDNDLRQALYNSGYRLIWVCEQTGISYGRLQYYFIKGTPIFTLEQAKALATYAGEGWKPVRHEDGRRVWGVEKEKKRRG